MHSKSSISIASVGSCSGTSISVSCTTASPSAHLSLSAIPTLHSSELPPPPTSPQRVTSFPEDPEDQHTPIVSNSTTLNPMPVARPASCSSRFPNVDVSTFRSPSPSGQVLHGCQGFPVQTTLPKSSFQVAAANPSICHSQPSLSQSPVNASWDQFSESRSAFASKPASRQHILHAQALSTPPTSNLGAHWTHYTVDPNNTHPIVDPLTNSIPPWRAY